jgi:hypothetical protein
MVLGYYPMDLIPAEVAKMEIDFNIASRSPTGGEVLANFVWKLDPPESWKLKPGEKWENAEESVRPLQDIDPAAAANTSARK